MLPYVIVFGRAVGMYGVMTVLGFFACGLTIYLLGRAKGLIFADIVLILLAAGGGILVGAHILYAITQWDVVVAAFASLPDFGAFWDQILIAFSGMVYYGGFIGSIGAMWLYTRYSKSLDRRTAFDFLGIGSPLFHFFGRIGCLFGGCCYGIESSFGIVCHGNPMIPEVNDVCRFPVQLIEAGCNLLIFLTVLLLYLKKKPKISLLAVYIFLYAPTRFILEFFRGDLIRGFVLGLSTSQWVSILLFIAALIYVFTRKKESKEATA